MFHVKKSEFINNFDLIQNAYMGGKFISLLKNLVVP